MTDFTQPLIDLLDALVPSGATHATEWYTLNELIAILTFYAILFWWFIVPIVTAPKIILNNLMKGKR